MIRLGKHPSAVVDVLGHAHIPSTTVLEPLAVIYVGASGRLDLGARGIHYPHSSIRIDQGWMTTGEDVSFGPGCHVYEPRAGLRIGNNCLIGGGSLICGVNHGFERLDIPIREQPTESRPITIGDNVWLGMGTIVLPGVSIGRGAVIGAGSVVTKDIPPQTVAVGTPCAVTRARNQGEPRKAGVQ